INFNDIKEIKPGHALVVNKAGNYTESKILDPLPKKSCSYERIYFSRGSDPDIYAERKKLGKYLIPQILESVKFDLKNTVFSYIPNTAETAFLGMISGIEDYLSKRRQDFIIEQKPTLEKIEKPLDFRTRTEELGSKDAKMRTFITQDAQRDDLVAQVYDTT